MSKIRNYALVGCGNRGMYMFAIPLTGIPSGAGAPRFSESARLCAVCDINAARSAYVSSRCGNVPYFTDFDTMLGSCDIDTVIVATTDCTHDEYILKALHAGYDVITEKPMTIDDKRCRAILKAEKETGKKVTVTFNVRFMPYVARIKEMIASGAIGNVLSVHLEYLLDTSHGADYFRRWHRRLENSGGLLVHKSTHHFDMVNWLIHDRPEQVFAYGSTKFYGPTREQRSLRCTGCPHTSDCEFYMNLKQDPDLEALYLNAEQEDGYFRDQCVFADEITTYDTMSVNVRYRKGSYLTYSLIAHSPYEGYRIMINGSKGRLEAASYANILHPAGSGDTITLFNRRGEAVVYNLPSETGDHGGGDAKLQRALFAPGFQDSLGQMASSFDGAMSILIGIAANQSILKGCPIDIASLLEDS